MSLIWGGDVFSNQGVELLGDEVHTDLIWGGDIFTATKNTSLIWGGDTFDEHVQ